MWERPVVAVFDDQHCSRRRDGERHVSVTWANQQGTTPGREQRLPVVSSGGIEFDDVGQCVRRNPSVLQYLQREGIHVAVVSDRAEVFCRLIERVLCRAFSCDRDRSIRVGLLQGRLGGRDAQAMWRRPGGGCEFRNAGRDVAQLRFEPPWV